MTTLIKKMNGIFNGATPGPGNEIPSAPPPATDSGGGGIAKSFADIKKRRGVKPGSKRGPYDKGNRPGVPAEPPAARDPAPQGTPLFTPAHAKLVAALPFNLAVAKTGWTGWALTPDESETLANPLAVTLNAFVTIDPKWVSVSLLAIALLSISGEKAILYRAALEEQRKHDTPAPAPAIEELK